MTRTELIVYLDRNNIAWNTAGSTAIFLIYNPDGTPLCKLYPVNGLYEVSE